MRAIVYTAPLELRAMEVAEPVPDQGEVLVTVGAAGICGSELEGFASQSPFRVPPLIMGHEFVGHLDDGTRIVVNPVVSCRQCDLCLRGMTNLCRHRSILGIHRAGGFAERVAVPAVNCYPLPDDVSLLGGAVIEPLANAVHAFRLAQQYDPLPLRVGVIGAGTLGFLTAMVAVGRGVPSVSIADLSEERRVQAVRTGASSVVERLEGEFDVIFDAVGTASTRASSVSLLRRGGTAVWIGLHGSDPGIDGLGLIRNEQRVLGTFCYQDQDYQLAILQATTLNTDWIRTYPLDDGVEVFHRLVDGDVSSVKTMLLPDGAVGDGRSVAPPAGSIR
jgi:threonine dehydrogenase-like Zn-dependent dehydrogenase